MKLILKRILYGIGLTILVFTALFLGTSLLLTVDGDWCYAGPPSTIQRVEPDFW